MYQRIVIAGVGLIGGSLGLALRRSSPGSRIIGVSSPDAVASAIGMGAIHEGCGYEELGTVAADADVVFLCTPIHRIQGLLTVLGSAVARDVLITDVGSTKKAITAHADTVLPPEVSFIGGHPMTGAESRGVKAADPFLFQNAIYVLCPGESVDEDEVQSFSGLLDGIGATVLVMDAAQHDRIAAAVSHLPQLLAVALVEMIGGMNSPDAPCLRLAAGGFRDMTRIASSSFSMWDDIFRTNREPVQAMLDLLIERLQGLRGQVGTSALGEHFETANVTRAMIPRDTKGFLRTLSEVLVVVEDKPGVIAHIAGELAENGINIKDIEVLKVREGEGGTLRLAFEHDAEATQAVDHLHRIGYTARMRQ